MLISRDYRDPRTIYNFTQTGVAALALQSFLEQSYLGQIVWQQGQSLGWQVLIAEGDCLPDIDFAQKIITFYADTPDFISSDFLMEGVMTLKRALQGDSLQKPFRPADRIIAERFAAADAAALAVLIARDLRTAGHGALWRDVLCGAYGDMAILLSDLLEKKPGADSFFQDSSIRLALFDAFFEEGERIALIDHLTLTALDDGDLPMGEASLTAKDIEDLGLLAGSPSYLSGLAEAMKTDPFYNDINDPINEAHLLEIDQNRKEITIGAVTFRDSSLARKFLLTDFPE